MEIKYTNSENKEFTVKMTDDETQYLVEYAFADLLKRGLLSLEDDPNSEDEAQVDYLRNCDVNTIPQS